MLKQTDPRWARSIIPPIYTVKSWGCTLTALCRLHFVINGKRATPDDMIKKLKFDKNGKLIWGSLAAIGLKASRFYRAPSSNEFQKHSIKNEKTEGAFQRSGMLIELNYSIRHWVALEYNSILGSFLCMDPLKGIIVRKPKKEICGFAIIEKF